VIELNHLTKVYHRGEVKAVDDLNKAKPCRFARSGRVACPCRDRRRRSRAGPFGSVRRPFVLE